MNAHNTQLAMLSVKWDMAFVRCVFHCVGGQVCREIKKKPDVAFLFS